MSMSSSQGTSPSSVGRGTRIVTLAVVAALVLGMFVGGLSFLSAPKGGNTDELVRIAESFPAPSVALRQQSASTTDPLTFTANWRHPGGADDACNAWRDSVRAWVGDVALGSVAGNVIPGRSCTYELERDNKHVRILVAQYEGDPQSTVSLTVR